MNGARHPIRIAGLDRSEGARGIRPEGSCHG